jgi:hypothetical protein
MAVRGQGMWLGRRVRRRPISSSALFQDLLPTR